MRPMHNFELNVVFGSVPGPSQPMRSKSIKRWTGLAAIWGLRLVQRAQREKASSDEAFLWYNSLPDHRTPWGKPVSDLI